MCSRSGFLPSPLGSGDVYLAPSLHLPAPLTVALGIKGYRESCDGPGFPRWNPGDPSSATPGPSLALSSRVKATCVKRKSGEKKNNVLMTAQR